jgi:hypothetical protein
MDPLTQIAEWPVDALRDDTHRYFFITPKVRRVIQGERCLVVGGKGTGKTALSLHLETRSGEKDHYIRLERNAYKFPNFLRRAGDGPAASERYIELWRYFILTKACESAGSPGSAARSPRLTQVSSLYNRALAHLRRFQFVRSQLGTDFDEMPEPGSEQAKQEIIYLDCQVKDRAAGRRFFMIFDELDEVYSGIESCSDQQEYLKCIAGLINACEAFTREKQNPVKPIILLRDDIYDAIPGGRKGKWTDIKVDLKWDTETIQRLLAFRIARAFDKNIDSEEPVFRTEWGRLFSEGKIAADGRMMEKFDYIAERTLNRPRDYVCFVKECADLLQKDDDKLGMVDAGLLRKAERQYSDYLWDELRDLTEPYVGRGVFAAIEKTAPNFTGDAFHAALKTITAREISREDALRELRELFKHGVIRDFDESGSAPFSAHKGLHSRLKVSNAN